jgi:tetratricopeptide (TPR) repeat protein
MTLAKAIAIALDRLKQELSELEAFSRLKVNGQELRRFYHASKALQREICFYRDKWWNKDGGVIHGELFCLVPEVQLALAACSQSLADPDYTKPFEHFQYSLSNSDVERSWQIRSLEDVKAFERSIKTWIISIALPWFEQFESQEGVLGYLERSQQWLRLARLHNHLGERAEALMRLVAWLETLPRNIEAQLDQLRDEGLLSDSERKMLTRASLQEETGYRQAVDAWRKSVGIKP